MNSFSPRNKTNKTRKTFGFTLVELIVVITILVILGTIAFVQLGGFAGSARDSARISNLNSLKTGLDLVQVKSGTYPLPESSVAIIASGVIIGFQGYAGEQVGSMAKLSPGATKDPLDPTMYITYSVNLAQTKMQAMSFLEDSSTATAYEQIPNFTSSLIPTANASSTSDYSKRYPKTMGDTLGILLSNTGTTTLNQPIQETNTGVDIVTTTGSYIAYFTSKNYISGTGSQLFSIIPVIMNGGSLDYKCDTPDITVSSGSITQTWQACNIGSVKAGVGIESYGYYFQWGRNMPAYGKTIRGPLNSDPGDNSLITNSDDWLLNKDDDLWGGSGTTTSNGIYSTQSSMQKIKMQGSCKQGYHIPTAYEWQIAISSNEITNDGTKFINILKVPYNGYRGYGDLIFYRNFVNPSSGGPLAMYLASSTPSGNNDILIHSTITTPALISFIPHVRALTYAIRCIKN